VHASSDHQQGVKLCELCVAILSLAVAAFEAAQTVKAWLGTLTKNIWIQTDALWFSSQCGWGVYCWCCYGCSNFLAQGVVNL
jgi:hypothetical protein